MFNCTYYTLETILSTLPTKYFLSQPLPHIYLYICISNKSSIKYAYIQFLFIPFQALIKAVFHWQVATHGLKNTALWNFTSGPLVKTLSFQCRGSIPGGEDPMCKKEPTLL